jgi:hypothetical protein
MILPGLYCLFVTLIPGYTCTFTNASPFLTELLHCSVEYMLLEKYIPVYHFREHHQKKINASAKECFIATKALDMNGSGLTKLLVRLRGLPADDLKWPAFLQKMCFSISEEQSYREIVIDASQNNRSIFWNFYFEPLAGNECLVSTETRVHCLTPSARRSFGIYWFFIRPFSGLIRLEMLRLLQRKVSGN